MGKKKKLKLDKTGAGDPTFRAVLQVQNEDNENSDSTFSITVGVNSNQIISIPACNLPATNESIILMAGFTAGSPTINQDGNINAETVLTFSLEEESIELILEDDTNLSGVQTTISNSSKSMTYSEITQLNSNAVMLSNSSQVGFQSREGEDTDQGIYVFLTFDTSGAGLITYSYFLSTNSECVWTIEMLNNNPNCFSIYNNRINQYLAFDGNLVFLSNTINPNTDARLQWNFDLISGSDTLYSIQNQYAINTQAASSYLGADPTYPGGNVGLQAAPSPWYIHIN